LAILKAEYTQEKIAEIFEVDRSLVSKILDASVKKMQMQDFHKDSSGNNIIQLPENNPQKLEESGKRTDLTLSYHSTRLQNIGISRDQSDDVTELPKLSYYPTVSAKPKLEDLGKGHVT